jgi:acetyl esterase/lipase
MKSRAFVSHLALVLLLLSGAGSLAAQPVEVLPDVVYGHKDGMALTFDVLRPVVQPNGAGVLFMVSGGWVSSYTPPAQSIVRFQSLLDRGFTVFVVRHGSSPKYLIPEIVADVRRATRFIRHNAERWAVDPERLGVFGGSAGGHLALMLGTAPEAGDVGDPEPFMRDDHRVASVVAYYPPVDLRSMARGLTATPPGGTTQRFPALNFEQEKAPAYSPIVHVSRGDPPTLLIHGDRDELVPLSHSERIHEAFRQHGVASELIVLPGAAHGFRGEDADRATAAMVSWFERTLLP